MQANSSNSYERIFPIRHADDDLEYSSNQIYSFSNVMSSSATARSGFVSTHELLSRSLATSPISNHMIIESHDRPREVILASTSVNAAILSLTKSAVGAGALFMPMCYYRLGLVGGLLSTTIATIVSTISLIFLGIACRRTGSMDYLQLASCLGGPSLEWITATCVILVALAPIIVYMRLSATYISNVILFTLGVTLNPKRLELILAFTIFWPMTWIKNGKKLAQFSTLGMLGMVYVAFISIMDFLMSTEWDFSMVKPFNSDTDWKSLHSSFTTILFSFSCHFTIPMMVNNLYHPSIKRCNQVILISSIIPAVFYFIIGTSGYLNYGPLVPEDMLAARPEHPAYILGQLTIALVNIASFPLLIIPVRGVLSWAYTKLSPPSQSITSSSTIGKVEKVSSSSSFTKNAVQGFGIIIISLITSGWFQSTADVFTVIGSICGGPVTLIFPALFFSRSESFLESQQDSKPLSIFIMIIIRMITILGIFIMLSGFLRIVL